MVPVPVPVTSQCLVAAADRYRVPVAALVGVMRAERGRVGMAHANPNGTDDYGPMQINSIWVPVLARYGITRAELRYNGCVNVSVGAWILQRRIAQTGALWSGIGAYHSAVPGLARRYEIHVYRALRALNENLVEAVNGAN